MATTEKKDTVTKEVVQKEKMVKIRLPKTRADEDDERVWVNHRSWQIKRGVEVEVPECVAEVLRNRELALEHIMLFKEVNTNN
jgi:hypothetical protein